MQEIKLEDIKQSSVLVRVGYDISNFEDISRLKSSYKTVIALLQNKNKVILVSKWGRPKGAYSEDLSLKLLLKSLKENYTNQDITFIDQFKYQSAEKLKLDIDNINSNIILFENLYFDSAENSKISEERLELASFYSKVADFFVDDCFISSHRKDATNFEIKSLLEYAYGVNYKEEAKNLNTLKENPQRPFFVLMGGAKLETKLDLINKMLEIADKVLIGGVLCYTFIQAQNELIQQSKIENKDIIDVFNSKIEPDFINTAKDLLLKYKEKIILPVDFQFKTIVENDEEKIYGFDIGIKSIERFKEELATCKMLFWNGPMGKVEEKPFDLGTNSLAYFLADQSQIFRVIGGGDTLSCVDVKSKAKFDYVSMGGGATLDYLSR